MVAGLTVNYWCEKEKTAEGNTEQSLQAEKYSSFHPVEIILRDISVIKQFIITLITIMLNELTNIPIGVFAVLHKKANKKYLMRDKCKKKN